MQTNSDSLFHYTKTETAIEYILFNKQLKFSTMNNSNDPYEKYNLVFSCDGKADDTIEAKLRDNATWLTENLKIGIQTLCTVDDMFSNNKVGTSFYNIGRGFAKPRMWAQYASDFGGVCLELDKQKLINSIELHYKKMGLLYGNIIYYSEEDYIYEVCNATFLNSQLSEFSHDDLLKRMENNYKNIYYFGKHMDWKDENEFRFLIRDYDGNDNFINIDDGILKRIIVGIEVNDDNLDKIRKIIESFNVVPDICRLDFWDGYYQLIDV